MKGVLVLLLTVTLLGHASAAPDPFIFDFFNYFLNFFGLGYNNYDYGYSDFGPDPYLDGGYGGDSQYLGRSGAVPEQKSGAEGEKNTESEGEKEKENDKGDSQNASAPEGESEKENRKKETQSEGNTVKEKRHSEIHTNPQEARKHYEWFHHPSSASTEQGTAKRETTGNQVEEKGFFQKAIEAVNRILQRDRRSFNYRNSKRHTSNERMGHKQEVEINHLEGGHNTGKRHADGHNRGDQSVKKRHVKATSRLLPWMVKRSAQETSDKGPGLYESFKAAMNRLLPMVMGKSSVEKSSDSLTNIQSKRAAKGISEKEFTRYESIDRFLPKVVNKRSAEESSLFENFLMTMADRFLFKVDKRSAEEKISEKEPTMYESIVAAVNRFLPKIPVKRSADDSSALESILINVAERILSEVDKRSAEDSSEKEPTLYERIMTTMDRFLPMIMSKRSVEESSGAEVASFENQEISGEIDGQLKTVNRLDLYNRILNDRL